MYQATTEARFIASHALKLPDGSYEPVHSHDWPVKVTVESRSLDAMDCVMDFHELERLVAGVIGPWDGKHLNDVAPFAGEQVNPSAERVAEQIALALMPDFQAPVRLVSVDIGEAPGCTATYRP